MFRRIELKIFRIVILVQSFYITFISINNDNIQKNGIDFTIAMSIFLINKFFTPKSEYFHSLKFWEYLSILARI